MPRTPRATEKQTTSGLEPGRRFRRQSQLADKASFGRVFDKATRSRDKLFTVLYRPNGTDAPRLGLAISKKNCRLAVGRNRLKRIIRESFRQQQDRMPGLDIVVLNQRTAARASNPALFSSLKNHWRACCRESGRKTLNG